VLEAYGTAYRDGQGVYIHGHRKKLVFPGKSTDRIRYKSSYAALCRWHAEP
jgi:hypothetical protein